MTAEEPKLCPDCPRKSLLHLVRSVSWNNAPAADTVVKLCSKLRANKDTLLPKCPYYPDNETLDNFLLTCKQT